MPPDYDEIRGDVWEKATSVDALGKLPTGLYSKTRSRMKADLRNLSSRNRILMGIDLASRVATLYVRGDQAEIPSDSLFVDVTNGRFWRIAGAGQFTRAPYPGSVGHWEYSLEGANSPVAEVKAEYPTYAL